MGGERAKPKGGSWAVPFGVSISGLATAPLVAYAVSVFVGLLMVLVFASALILIAGFRKDSPRWLRTVSQFLAKPIVQATKVRHARWLTQGLSDGSRLSIARRWRLVRTVDRDVPTTISFRVQCAMVWTLGGMTIVQVMRLLREPFVAVMLKVPGVNLSERTHSTVFTIVLVAVGCLGLSLGMRFMQARDWRLRHAKHPVFGVPRCGGCQYPLAGIPLVHNAVTCPECGDLNRFWPGSKPHAAMVEAVASDHSIARPTETS